MSKITSLVKIEQNLRYIGHECIGFKKMGHDHIGFKL